MSAFRLFALTCLAMVAFAANSVLGREGLLGGDIDAGSFALIRLVSGAMLLLLIAAPKRAWKNSDWRSGSALFVYAAFFAYAYIAIGAGTGALILFAIVQIVMTGAGWLRGERLSPLQWGGLALALGALGWWLLPSAEAPSPLGAASMMIAGIGWGAYSLFGLGQTDPVGRTAGNFLRATLLALPTLSIAILSFGGFEIGWRGAALAVASGAITSGLGYVIWYAALRGLTATRAGVAQLTVPVIAALGGILIGEPLTVRFSIAAALILTGVALASFAKPKPSSASNS